MHACLSNLLHCVTAKQDRTLKLLKPAFSVCLPIARLHRNTFDIIRVRYTEYSTSKGTYE